MMRTPDDAKALLCPFARSFIFQGGTTLADAGCHGPKCALWRWESVTTAHPLWKDAVLKKGAELGERVPYAKAAAWVVENKEALGLVPTKGFCGVGGQS